MLLTRCVLANDLSHAHMIMPKFQMVVDHTENLAHKCWDCKKPGWIMGCSGQYGSVIPRGVVSFILRPSRRYETVCAVCVLCLYVSVSVV